jgi:allophanate hydrolase subunit 2
MHRCAGRADGTDPVASAGLRVLHPGTCATVQDLGRPGFRAFGVSPGGAFDRGSLVLANALAGNPPGAATLELTLLGGTFEALGPLLVALAGAPMSAILRDPDGSERPCTVPGTIPVEPGQLLVLGGTPRGARTYLAVPGGFRTPAILGCRSVECSPVIGYHLPAMSSRGPARRLVPGALGGTEPCQGPIRFFDGPDAPTAGGDSLDGRIFRVGVQSNRVGLRLEAEEEDRPRLAPIDAGRLSAPVAPGAIQWTGHGWIILGVAGGTMGGYPHIGQVAAADLDRVGQLRPGDAVWLRRIGLAEARALEREAHRRLRAEALRICEAARDGLWVGLAESEVIG